MGFSVSGATALLLIAFLVAFGTFYTATMGSVERVQEAQINTQEDDIAALNTDIEIQSAVYNESASEQNLTIAANNTGAEALQPTDVSLLVNGSFVEFGQENISLSNSDTNELWVPQQQLNLTIGLNDLPEAPSEGDTVKLVTEYAVADTAQVTVVT